MAKKDVTAKRVVDQLSATLGILMREVLQEKTIKSFISEEIRNMPPYKIELVVNSEKQKTIDGYARPELEEALNLAYHRLNVLMVGPAGCGKTYIAKQVAEAMELPFGSISCSSGMSESHLTGWLIPMEHGRFEYIPSVFVNIYEKGGVFLFDEIDAADSNTLLFVNQALANKSFFIPQRHENPEVKQHPDCIIMAAANTYGTGANLAYAGRERLDESTLDRFRAGLLPVGYDHTLENSLVDSDILSWGRDIRTKINTAKLQRVMSTRFMADASRLKKSGASMEKIKKTYFHGWREDEIRKVS